MREMKIVAVIFIIIIMALIGKYILKRGKSEIIYYESISVVTSHAPTHTRKYIIYDSGIIEETYDEGELGLDEQISSKKITRKELKELKNCIEKVAKTKKTRKDSKSNKDIFGAVSISHRYVYKGEQKIVLDDIESEELKGLEKFVSDLKEKYCK